ncbi:hypothetical protein Hanom_Chr12g01127931 [Helianthus anomalus]
MCLCMMVGRSNRVVRSASPTDWLGTSEASSQLSVTRSNNMFDRLALQCVERVENRLSDEV